MQFVDKAGQDQGLCCPLTELMDDVVYIDKQRMVESNSTDVHAELHLSLHCLQSV